MGLIENIQDYFIKNSQEYKTFISRMVNTSPEIFYMDGERRFSKKEQKFFRIFNKNVAKRYVNHSNSRETTEKSNLNKEINFIRQLEKVKVDPATKQQIDEFFKVGESKDSTAYVELYSKQQLNSIPDYIEGLYLSKGDKINLLLNNYPELYDNGKKFTYYIDKDDYLKKHIISNENNLVETNMELFVLKEDVVFKEIKLEVIDTMTENFRPTYLEEKDKVEIIPATAEQKLQYSQHLDGEEFTEMPSVNFPEFSNAQLNSVPDIIDEIPLTEYEKKMILLDSFEFSASNNWSSTFSIDENNKLISKYHDIDSNNEVFEIKRHISKVDVMYANQNEIKIQHEAVKPEITKHVQLSDESNLSIDNIYGFSPTAQQKEDLKTGKGITGEIQGKNYFIMLSAQEKNKGNLQILSMEKAKELNLISEKNHIQKNIKQIGLRV